jgi:hypothetical protein
MMEGISSVTGLSGSYVAKDDDNELISDHVAQWIIFIVKTHELN